MVKPEVEIRSLETLKQVTHGDRKYWEISDGPAFTLVLRQEIPAGAITSRHYHDDIEIIVPFSGDRLVVITDKGEKEVPFGSVIYVTPGALHQLKNAGEKPSLAFILIQKKGHTTINV